MEILSYVKRLQKEVIKDYYFKEATGVPRAKGGPKKQFIKENLFAGMEVEYADKSRKILDVYDEKFIEENYDDLLNSDSENVPLINKVFLIATAKFKRYDELDKDDFILIAKRNNNYNGLVWK